MLKDINGCNNGTYHSSIVSQMDNLKHWRKRKIMKTLNSNELKNINGGNDFTEGFKDGLSDWEGDTSKSGGW